MKISNNGLEFIKKWEGCSLKAYLDPAKVWTIGVGHTGRVDNKSIKAGMEITEEKAMQLLKTDLAFFAKSVNSYTKVKLTQNQFDALVSFTFNVGAYSLKKSTLLRKLNTGDYAGAAKEFNKWNKADTDNDGKLETVKGLTNRRKAEAKLFLKK